MKFFTLNKEKRKRKKALPVQAVCRNCGAQMQGPYCSQCGQYLFAGIKESVIRHVGKMFDLIFAWDSKILVTLKYLLFFPGKLTHEYLQGRIIRYVHPTKLFWFIIIVFLFLVGAQISIHDKKDKNGQNKVNIQLHPTTTAKPINIQIKPTITAESSDSLAQPFKATDGNEPQADNEPQDEEKQKLNEFLNKIITYAPYAILLMIPFFTFLLYLLFRKKYGYFTEHIVFSFHFHSFVFLLFSCILAVSILLDLFLKKTYDLENVWACSVLLIFPGYFAISLYKVYKPKIGELIRKTLFVIVTYGIAVLIAVVFFVIFIAWLIGELEWDDIFS